VLIVYASVTGNASKWADELGSILRSAANVHFVDACRAKINSPEGAEVLAKIQSSTLTVFVSSTQGNGELPGECRQFFSSLFDANGYIFAKKQCAVLGFGSSAYPIFCGAAVHLSNKLAYNNAEEIVTRGQCDAVKGEASTFYSWVSFVWQKGDILDRLSI
jgi:sulfite reductase (NADPH) flavoprotein alpha-component